MTVQKHNLISLDGLVCLLLGAAYLSGMALPPVLVALVIMLVSAFVAADIFARPSFAYTAKFAIAWLLIAIVAILPTLISIYLRHTTTPFQYVHDGAIQTEEAVKFLLAGKNPYVENYFGTPLERWIYVEEGVLVNPALYHLAYWPFLLLFSIPFYLLAQATLGWFDERMIYLPMFVLTLVLLTSLARKRELRLALLLIAGLGPLFVPFLIEGRNDVFVLFWLTLAVVLTRKGKLLWSVVALALACASKPTAWFVIPFYGLYWWALVKRSSASVYRHLAAIALFAVVAGAAVLPFVVWNPSAFVDDVWNYTAGNTASAYPIKSWGFGGVALQTGWIANKTDLFPFSVLQLIFGLPTLLLLLGQQWTHNTDGRMWVSYGFLTLVIAFFSRVFNDNHMGYIILLFAIGALTNDVEPEPSAVATLGT